MSIVGIASLLGCAEGAPGDAGPPGALEGQLAVFIADRDDGTAEKQFFLELPGGDRQRLLFEREPALQTGAVVRAWGTPAGPGELSVAGYREKARPVGDEARRSALLDGTPLPPRTFAFVLLDTGGGVNLTTAQAAQEMFDASYFAANKGSVRRYYQEDSFDTQDISGTVVGPIQYTPTSTCDTQGPARLKTQVDAMLGGPANNYLWYFGSRQAGCSWAGLASLGTPASPTKDTWFNASAGCVVLVQEPGHNFGMQHSSSMKCSTTEAFVDAPDGACTHSEYGDVFDPMGSGCRHMNAWQKQYQGWLGGCNSVRVTASGTFTLLPLEAPCNGIQVLQIPMAHKRTFSYSGGGNAPTTDELTSYYVELRAQPTGFDQTLTPQVQVRVGGDYRPRSQQGLHTWLLDMKPATTTFNDAAMAVGQTFADPAGGLSFTATAVDAASATITVTIDNGSGAPTCLDGTTLAPPGPQTCAGTGAGGTTGAGGGGSTGSLGAGGTIGAGGAAGASGGPGAAGETGGGGPTATGTGGGFASDGGQPPGETSPSGCGCGLAARGPRSASAILLVIAFTVQLARRRRAHNAHVERR